MEKCSDGNYLKIKAAFLIEIYERLSYFVFSIKKWELSALSRKTEIHGLYQRNACSFGYKKSVPTVWGGFQGKSAPNHNEATDGQGRKTHTENFSSEILKIYNIKCSYLSIDVKSFLVAVYFYCHKSEMHTYSGWIRTSILSSDDLFSEHTSSCFRNGKTTKKYLFGGGLKYDSPLICSCVHIYLKDIHALFTILGGLAWKKL